MERKPQRLRSSSSGSALFTAKGLMRLRRSMGATMQHSAAERTAVSWKKCRPEAAHSLPNTLITQPAMDENK